MTARSRAAATASLMAAVWGCGANGEPTAAVIAVSPPMAYNNAAGSLLIEGGPFRPAYRFDSMAAKSSTDLGAFSARLTPASGADVMSAPITLDPVSWLSIGLLTAALPSGIPAGAYDVDVTDPRGQHTGLQAAFLSLGPDKDPPALTIEAPHARAIIGAQTTVTVTLTADDGAGLLASLDATVSAGTLPPFTSTCTVPPATAATICHFQFTAPAPSGADDIVVIEAHAKDSAGNPALARAGFPLASPPTVTGLAPSVGPASGGTAIDIHGTNFVKPTDNFEGSVLLIDGVPADPSVNMVEVVSDTEITAITSSHDPGYATLTVATGDAITDRMYFQFFAAPVVRMVSPNRGPLSGGTKIAVVGSHFRNGKGTIISIGGTELVNPCFVSANWIEGFLPVATESGSVTVLAHDPIGGDGVLGDAFTYDPAAADAPDGGVEPTSCGGTP